MILANKILCCTLVFLWQWFCSFLFTDANLNQRSIHHNEVEDALFTSMKHMHMNRLMFIRIEVKDKTEIFEYLWHRSLILITTANLQFFTETTKFSRLFHYLSMESGDDSMTI